MSYLIFLPLRARDFSTDLAENNSPKPTMSKIIERYVGTRLSTHVKTSVMGFLNKVTTPSIRKNTPNPNAVSQSRFSFIVKNLIVLLMILFLSSMIASAITGFYRFGLIAAGSFMVGICLLAAYGGVQIVKEAQR